MNITLILLFAANFLIGFFAAILLFPTLLNGGIRYLHGYATKKMEENPTSFISLKHAKFIDCLNSVSEYVNDEFGRKIN